MYCIVSHFERTKANSCTIVDISLAFYGVVSLLG
jgi:hypothetical protein